MTIGSSLIPNICLQDPFERPGVSRVCGSRGWGSSVREVSPDGSRSAGPESREQNVDDRMWMDSGEGVKLPKDREKDGKTWTQEVACKTQFRKKTVQRHRDFVRGETSCMSSSPHKIKNLLSTSVNPDN